MPGQSYKQPRLPKSIREVTRFLDYYIHRNPDRNRWPAWLIKLADYQHTLNHKNSHHRNQQAFENEMEDLAVVDKPYLLEDLTKQQLREQHGERIAANCGPVIRIDPVSGERTVLPTGRDGGYA